MYDHVFDDLYTGGPSVVPTARAVSPTPVPVITSRQARSLRRNPGLKV